MVTTACRVCGIATIAVIVTHAAAHGQSLAQRIADAPDGSVQISFASRPGVCGDGGDAIMVDGSFFGSYRRAVTRGAWMNACIPGSVRVALVREKRRVTRVRTRVGGPSRATAWGTTDLGMVPAPEAATYLLSLAAHSDGAVGEDAILAAALAADVTIWPSLLAIARDRTRPRATRESAMFWLARAAAEATGVPTDPQPAEEDDQSVRGQAVFALSQLDNNAGVPALIDVARSHPDPWIRGKAIFWLGQSDDPRAVELMHQLLQQ